MINKAKGDGERAAEVPAASSAASQNPDQQDTLQCDLSPIARNFYGPLNTKTNIYPDASTKEVDPEEELLRAKTRRLDSFAAGADQANGVKIGAVAEVEEDGGEKAMEVNGEEPNGTHEEVMDAIQPRNLNSVFDQEAGWY